MTGAAGTADAARLERLLREGRFLISQSFLYSYGGSEVITLELVEQLASGGATVAVLTHGCSDALADEVRRLGGSVLRPGDTELDEYVRAGVDVAWVHQQLLPEQLLRDPGDTVFVYNHMSSFHPLEFPWAPRVENELAAVAAFPSEESREAQQQTGLLASLRADQLLVLGNPAPDAFFAASVPPADDLRRVLVVSNHVPEELLAAVELLRARVDVDLVGLEREKGSRPERVTPKTLEGVDAVITIGKTVQFAVAAGIPVFCYDHFGGPGWLDTDNLDRARWHNFSGRGFGRLDGEQIASAVLEGYAAARAGVDDLRDRLGAGLRWSTTLREVLASALAAERSTTRPAVLDVEAHLRAQAALGTYMVMGFELDAARAWYQGQYEVLTSDVAELRGEVERLAGADADLVAALGREEEIAAAFRGARSWAAHVEADAAELRQALADAERAGADAEIAAGRAERELAAARERADALEAEIAQLRAAHDLLAGSRAVRLARALRGGAGA